MSEQKVNKKNQIFFSRAYRHLKPNKKERLLFLLLCVLPCLILYLIFYTKISLALAIWVKQELSTCVPGSSLSIAYGEFLPIFGGAYFVQIPSKMPSFQEIAINLVATLVLLCIVFVIAKKKKGGTSLTIFFAIILLTHLIACIYFMFASKYFPYSATQYSELYIKQQVSIWLSFLIMSGLLSGVLGYGKITGKLAVFFGTLAYSFIFGCVRCLAFLYIISKGSSLYMATLFFSLGPLFDFLYLVCFYVIHTNAQIKYYDQGEGRLKWHWL